jgi:hypothetical protein
MSWMLWAALTLQAEDPFREMELGQRVEVTMKGGSTLRGALCAPRGVETYDLQKSSQVALDLTFEYLRLGGQVAFEKQSVVAVAKLPALSQAKMEAILAAKKIEIAKLTKDEQKRIAQQEAWIKKAIEIRNSAESKKFEDLEKGAPDDKARLALEVYNLFPESAGWGRAKYELLAKFLIPSGQKTPKYLDARVPVVAPGLNTFAPAKDDEAAFYDNFELWLTGKALAEKAAEAGTEAGKPATTGTAEPKATSDADKSAAQQAFVAYRTSLQSLDPYEVRKHVASSKHAALSDKAYVEELHKLSPAEPRVVDVTISENSATLELEALKEGRTVRGRAVLIREEGGWKVNEEHWDLRSGGEGEGK